MTTTEIKIEKKKLLLQITLDKRDRLTRQINKAAKLRAVVEDNLAKIRMELLNLGYDR